ncbi:hypothetical protein BZA77DRAFT_293261 [Pyronema omphalodes]|nr:hypothetical protein BZA77DRAFT_293261 [Pyronema omphalodes]
MQFSISAISLLLLAPLVVASQGTFKPNMVCQVLEEQVDEKLALSFNQTGTCCAIFGKTDCQDHILIAQDQYDHLAQPHFKIRSRMCSTNCDELKKAMAIQQAKKWGLIPNKERLVTRKEKKNKNKNRRPPKIGNAAPF